MTAPNRHEIVQRVWALGQWELGTDAGKAAFTRAVAWELHKEDVRWGLVRVKPPHTQVQGYSTDLVMWEETGEIVDVATDRGPTWLAKPPIDRSRWATPPRREGPPAPPPDDTPPPPATDVTRETYALLQRLSAHLGLR